jgi:hypothetical protein
LTPGRHILFAATLAMIVPAQGRAMSTLVLQASEFAGAPSSGSAAESPFEWATSGFEGSARLLPPRLGQPEPGQAGCGRSLPLAGLPPSISPCPGPEPVVGLPQLELWHAPAGEPQGPGLDLQPASIKLDAWPGGDAGPRELGLAAADGLRLDAGATKLVRQTAYLATIGVMVIGGLILAPESVSKWDTSNPARFIGSMPANWSEHVSQGPVVDGDKWAINYIGHPISGSFYYQVARHDGFGVVGSTIYSAAMSGLFWEFGIEAMAEVPSTQDLIVTPLGGALLGEAFYQVEQVIDAGGGTVLGSRVLGGISKFLLNPAGTIVDGIDATVVGSSDRPASGSGLSARSMLVAYPMSYPGHPELRGNYVGLQMIFTIP